MEGKPMSGPRLAPKPKPEPKPETAREVNFPNFLDLECSDRALLEAQIQGRDLLAAERKAMQEIDKVFDSIRERVETERQLAKRKLKIFYEDEYRKLSDFMSSFPLSFVDKEKQQEKEKGENEKKKPEETGMRAKEKVKEEESEDGDKGKEGRDRDEDVKKKQAEKCDTVVLVESKVNSSSLESIEIGCKSLMTIQTLPKKRDWKITRVHSVRVTTEAVFAITNTGDLNEYSHQGIFRNRVSDHRKASAISTSPDHLTLYCMRLTCLPKAGETCSLCVYGARGLAVREWKVEKDAYGDSRLAANSSSVYVAWAVGRRVKIFTEKGESKGEFTLFGDCGSSIKELTASDECLYVLQDFDVHVYSCEGAFLQIFSNVYCTQMSVSPNFFASFCSWKAQIFRFQGNKISKQAVVTSFEPPGYVCSAALYQRTLFLVIQNGPPDPPSCLLSYAF